jgi:hypothetical protein
MTCASPIMPANSIKSDVMTNGSWIQRLAQPQQFATIAWLRETIRQVAAGSPSAPLRRPAATPTYIIRNRISGRESALHLSQKESLHAFYTFVCHSVLSASLVAAGSCRSQATQVRLSSRATRISGIEGTSRSRTFRTSISASIMVIGEGFRAEAA